ncbi:hypothetical protein ACFCYM_17180, partial [Streptomyces sp. NPDC056254]
AQRMRSRAPLGEPLTQLPPTAVPANPPSGPRVRSGIGAPLPSMPARAAVPAVPAAPTAPSAAKGPAGARPPVQRATAAPRRSGPVPLVAARAVGGAGAARVAPPSLQLLAARPLTLGTQDAAGMGSAPAAAPRPASRPVVPARWATPSAPSAASAAAPQQPVQRASAPAARTPAPGPVPRPAHAAHAVRPAPAAAARATATPLPVTGPYTPPLGVQPAPAAPVAGSVPVVRPRSSAPAASPQATVPVPRPPTAPPPPVQRDTGGGRTGSGPLGPARAHPGGTTAGQPDGARDAAASGGGDLDLDDLARRLLDPVARLLRTELRRGRERAGRPFDGRR